MILVTLIPGGHVMFQDRGSNLEKQRADCDAQKSPPQPHRYPRHLIKLTAKVRHCEREIESGSANKRSDNSRPRKRRKIAALQNTPVSARQNFDPDLELFV